MAAASAAHSCRKEAWAINRQNKHVWEIMMKLGKDSKIVEYTFLAIFLAVMLYIGPGTILDHRITHDYPYGYFASDAFGEIAYADWFNEHGKLDYLPAYLRFGYNDTVAFHMPIFYSLNAIHANLTGFEIYDGTFLPYLFIIIACMVIYLINRNFNRHAAFLGIGLGIFLFFQKFVTGWLWGNWDFALALMITATAFWVLGEEGLKAQWALLGVLLAASILTHISETIFICLFIGFLLAVKLARREFTAKWLREIVFAGLLSAVISFNYLIAFMNGYWRGSSFSVFKVPPEPYHAALSNFGIVLWVLAAGFIVSLYFAAKKGHYAALPAVFMLAIGFGNNFGLDNRALQARYAWPIFFAVFLGLAVYWAIKLTIKKMNSLASIGIGLLLLAAMLFTAGYKDTSSPGIMNPYHWDMLMWIRENTEPGSRVMFFYGDIYNQDALLWNNRRLNYFVDTQDYVSALQNRSIRREYKSMQSGASDALQYKLNYFRYEYHNLSNPRIMRDICSFDYLVFDRVASQQAMPLIQYNIYLANEISKSNKTQAVFLNEAVVILKNMEQGGACIEEKQI